MKLYEKRKKTQLKTFKHSHTISSQKYSFLSAVMNDELILHRRKKEEIEKDMNDMQFVKIDESYDYLLRLNILSFTEEKLQHLQEEIRKIESQIKLLEDTSPGDIWLSELETFEQKYTEWERKMAY